MARLIVVQPRPFAALTSSRGSGVANLASADPKEVWADSEAGSAATITVDLGAVVTIDTVFLGHLLPPAAAATWSIGGGIQGPAETALLNTSAVRVPDVAGHQPLLSHALWTGQAVAVRYLRITLTQPAGAAPLTAGVLIVGKAFVAQLGKEWGSGRRPIDTGTATALPSGGFAIVPGAKKRALTWTFGDLSEAEADQLDMLAEALGQTSPGLVVEDPEARPGLRIRIHYGLFKWRAFERRNRAQTRWEMEIEQWA